jgi:phosphoribosylglycinamide formyltransferase-1
MSLRLGMLASHAGSNVQRVVRACQAGELAASPAVIISNNRASGVLDFGRANGIPSLWIGGSAFEDEGRRDDAIHSALADHGAEIVLLLGYMRKLGPATLAGFRDRILNIHPSLLPKHGGQGRYGIHVHESVVASGDSETGVSIHLVSEHYDQGPVIAQCRMPVVAGDTPAGLQARVLVREHEFLVETLKRIVNGSLGLAAVAPAGSEAGQSRREW